MSYSNHQDIELIPRGVDEKKSIIKVIGVGGGGCNAVSQMFLRGIKNIDMAVCNTDSQSLEKYPVPEKIKLGELGAGCDPEVGKNAALEHIDEIRQSLSGKTKMVFITAGMGGGTGTGAAPVVAQVAREMNLLTIGIVTQPSNGEGPDTRYRAYNGIKELSKRVDSLLVINNQKINETYGDLSLQEGFSKSDDVLYTAIKGIAEIITCEGYINVDFADVKKVMTDSGFAIMGIGEASGENRAQKAVEEAFNSPLLNDYDPRTAKKALINITTCKDKEQGLRFSELEEITTYIKEHTGKASNFKRGVVYDANMPAGTISVTVVATGFNMSIEPEVIDTSEDEDTIVLDMSKPEDDSIFLPIPDDSNIFNGHARDMDNLDGITTYTGKYSISTMENETAYARMKRAMAHKIQEQDNL